MIGFTMMTVYFFLCPSSRFRAKNVLHSLTLKGDSGGKFVTAGILFLVVGGEGQTI